MDLKELNNKLLKFAGIIIKEYSIRFGGPPTPHSGYYLNDKYLGRDPIDLVNDSNLQQKYLYPKLIELWG